MARSITIGGWPVPIPDPGPSSTPVPGPGAGTLINGTSRPGNSGVNPRSGCIGGGSGLISTLGPDGVGTVSPDT